MNINISKFLNKQNIKLLWDVLLDELQIDINNKSIVTNIRTVFESNINPFTSNANKIPHLMLVELNKQFLSQVVIAVNRLFPNLKKEKEFKLINITSEEIVEPYKVEDIHSARQDNFEKQVLRKRLEFEKSINLNKPAELDFSEKMDDGKIKEMDSLIAETIARRNFDIEQFQPKIISENNDNWIQQQPQQQQPQQQKPQQQKPQQQINTNKGVQKKKVTWTEGKLSNNILQGILTNNENYQDFQNTLDNQENISLLIEEPLSPLNRINSNTLSPLENSLNIFNKIKKVKDVNVNVNANANSQINETQINELNQKYDELNNKVDFLIGLMTKLTNHFEINHN
jgi:hypothetical protein